MTDPDRPLDHSIGEGDSAPAPQGRRPANAPPPASDVAPAPDLTPAPDLAPAPDSEPAATPSDAPPPRTAPPAPVTDRVGRFRLDRVVGSGGMGVVYEAWDEDLMRRVAVKVLAPGLTNDVTVRRFAQEAILTARLQHPNIVSIYEAGQADGRAYIAMEFVEGSTLEGKIDGRLGEGAGLEGPEREEARLEAVTRMGSQDAQEICRWIRDVARALHCGHTATAPESDELAPIVHRDVKPGNIMVDRRGQACLLDFGLAKEMGVALTVTREALGTPLYMSPEQLFSARRVGPRSDVYSLGMTLYACMTLARPFELSSPGQLFEHLMHDEPVDPAKLHPALPPDVRTIILEAIAKDERRRYESAEALADDLDAYLEGRPIKAQPPGLGRRIARFARRRWKPLTATATALLLLVGLGINARFQERRRVVWERAEAERTARDRVKAIQDTRGS